MSFIAGVLTLFLVADSLLLILLVLVQLPKKDAGAGLAFGSGAADALFGAGSGNALTKITKYATVVFFVLTLGIGFLQDQKHRGDTSAFEKQLQQIQSQPQPSAPAPATTPATEPKSGLMSAQPAAGSIAPAAPASTNK